MCYKQIYRCSHVRVNFKMRARTHYESLNKMKALFVN